MTTIHPTAIVHPNARIGENVVIGPFSIIEDKVEIGSDTVIQTHIRIAQGTTIGPGCKIFQGAVLGTEPQDLKFGNEETFVEIGSNTTIREYATVNRGTNESYKTVVGNNCLLMAYSHIAHDCRLGNNVVIANAVNMAGHVIIEDYVSVGGMTAIHQFVHIGTQTFVGGGLRVTKDVPPFILAMGEPLKYGGLNKVGLGRRGFSDETLRNLRRAYRILYSEHRTVSDALAILEAEFSEDIYVEKIIKFVQSSDRGIIRE
jgi:UDP-N-acetylglucosamine acyltransferase